MGPFPDVVVDAGVSFPDKGVEVPEDKGLDIGCACDVPLIPPFAVAPKTGAAFLVPQAPGAAAGVRGLEPPPSAGNSSSDRVSRILDLAEGSEAFCFPAAISDIGP